MRPLRLLHTSDVHLAGGFSTPKSCDRRHECLCPILGIADLAEQHRPDLLLVVGDLFDHARVPEEMVQAAFDVLAKLDVPTVLISGNHDIHDDASLYRRHEPVVGGAGVTFIDEVEGATLRLLDGELVIWGRAMDDHHPGFRPLHGVPGRPEDDAWYVVLGHGHYVGQEPADASMRSSPITDDDIVATDADYVALGHWHTLTDVSAGGVPAWYAGSPMMSWSDGVALLVDLVPGEGARVEPLAVVPPPTGCA